MRIMLDGEARVVGDDLAERLGGTLVTKPLHTLAHTDGFVYADLAWTAASSTRLDDLLKLRAAEISVAVLSAWHSHSRDSEVGPLAASCCRRIVEVGLVAFTAGRLRATLERLHESLV